MCIMAEKLITEINQWDSISPVSSMLPYKNWKEKRWKVKSLIFFLRKLAAKNNTFHAKIRIQSKAKIF